MSPEGIGLSLAPVVFIGHGSPTELVERGPFAGFLQENAPKLARARALVVFSAHWLTSREVRVTAAPELELIYDFYGFPEALYRDRAPLSGSPELAARTVALVQAAGFAASSDAGRGVDHGVWTPLAIAFRDQPAMLAELPVIQVSLPHRLAHAELIRLGEVLAPLRSEGNVLLGSGNFVHNLSRVDFTQPLAHPAHELSEFESTLWAALLGRRRDLLEDPARIPGFAEAHPEPSHLLPLYPIFGALSSNDRPTDVFAGFHFGAISMRSCFLTS